MPHVFILPHASYSRLGVWSRSQHSPGTTGPRPQPQSACAKRPCVCSPTPHTQGSRGCSKHTLSLSLSPPPAHLDDGTGVQPLEEQPCRRHHARIHTQPAVPLEKGARKGDQRTRQGGPKQCTAWHRLPRHRQRQTPSAAPLGTRRRNRRRAAPHRACPRFPQESALAVGHV